jgi:hypothetical protein
MVDGPWVELAVPALVPLLPRRLRMIALALQMWCRGHG